MSRLDCYKQLLEDIWEVNGLIDNIEELTAYRAINNYTGGFFTYQEACELLADCRDTSVFLLRGVHRAYSQVWDERDYVIQQILAEFAQGDIDYTQACERLEDYIGG